MNYVVYICAAFELNIFYTGDTITHLYVSEILNMQ